MVDLQCCANFRYIAKWLRHMYTYIYMSVCVCVCVYIYTCIIHTIYTHTHTHIHINTHTFSYIIFHHSLFQEIGYSSLCYRVGSHFLSFFFFFQGLTCSIWRFPGQGQIRSSSCQPTPQPQQNTGSEPCLRPTPQLMATPDF